MSVYVDKLRPVSVSRAWRWPKAAHLLADSVEELHTFAKKIGLQRRWFQAKSFPHYDLTPARHFAAMKHGAKLLTDRADVVEVIRRFRASQTNAMGTSR